MRSALFARFYSIVFAKSFYPFFLFFFLFLSYVVVMTATCMLSSFSGTYHCILLDMRMILKIE